MSTKQRTKTIRRATESVTEAVVAAIADELDADPLAIDPLHDAVDPDALEALFENTDTAARRGGEVSFESNGCRITVSATGDVSARALPSSR
ncbi:hypothetical protein G9464_08100 [Halostella sp. JP-L12]|uniref:HalOD1 output domain-containing protein n=1 Tax=Halostella TaxID=1843185 RepID=UPI000EF789C7|nr:MULTISPECIES: HalOD1 output domain-containing protein [Halostella]NHN47557.1 hypothetical protein [Halostella sp. JP-L12]